MIGSYTFSPYILPMLASVLVTAALGLYGLRHRSVPGALAFAAVMLSMVAWGIGAMLELAAVDVATKIFWVKCQAVFQFPGTAAEFWFVLEYSHLSRWLNRRTAALLVGSTLLILVLTITNDVHHLLWLGFTFDGDVRPVRGIANWVIAGYGYLLSIASLFVFVWLFSRSPRHRVPVAMILCGLFATRVAYALDTLNLNPVFPIDLTILIYILPATLFALALFRFRFFDLVPIARETVIAQIREGVLVLDPQRRIVDLNPAAEQVLATPAARARGRWVQDLPTSAEWLRLLDDPGQPQAEITLGQDNTARHLAVQVSPMHDESGLPLGYVVLFHDITESKRAQALLLEQQSAVATLGERDRIARELHDSLGQVLGYVKMQGQAARTALAQGHPDQADEYLAHLIAVAQDAHVDVREYILGAGTGLTSSQEFLPVLRQTLQRFGESFGIAIDLDAAPELNDHVLAPTVWVQLLRIIQEALSNVRKHARATHIHIDVRSSGDDIQTVVQDNGKGFDPALVDGRAGKFGLRFMEERATEVHGSVQIKSELGKGTEVTILVPRRENHEGTTR